MSTATAARKRPVAATRPEPAKDGRHFVTALARGLGVLACFNAWPTCGNSTTPGLGDSLATPITSTQVWRGSVSSGRARRSFSTSVDTSTEPGGVTMVSTTSRPSALARSVLLAQRREAALELGGSLFDRPELLVYEYVQQIGHVELGACEKQ